MSELFVFKDVIGSGGGGKGGSESSGANETPDSLHSTSYAKFLDLISTGEISGLVNGLQSVFADGTPLQNADGSLNFKNVTVDFRPGTQTQEPISGFPSVENEIGIGVELKSDAPWIRSLTDTQLSAVRVRLAVPGLRKANTSNGDINGYRVEYAVDVATDNGVYVEVDRGAFDGKTTQTYERSIRVNLPPASIGWSVRVRRLTPNANSDTVSDRTNVAAITTIVDAKFRYPMAALIGVQVDASQFPNIPTLSYHIRGRILRVPTNYDAVARTYTGPWDGTFKLAYTNNPAWVLYDLFLNDIYGLGRRITQAQINIYELYQIAQYCDQLVPDGKGGEEPRYTFNAYIQARVAAWKLIQDIAATFHGLAYWAGGQIIVSADMPRDPVWTYNQGDTVDGKFSRTGTPSETRYTVALVSWNDNTDGGRQKVEPVIDREGIRRYGVRQIELQPLGCTSQGQAHRHGQWALVTSRLEKEVVTFRVGLDALRAAPGRVIRIDDPARAGRRNGGRIRSATADSVTIDKAPVMGAGDTIICMLPSAVPEKRIVASVDGDTVRVTEEWSAIPNAESIWSVETAELAAQTYSVRSVKDLGGLIYEITALQHEPGKFAYIDNGTRIETPPITVIPPSVQPGPESVEIGSYQVINQGISTSVMTISWPAARSAIAYAVEWKKDDGNWISLPRTGQLIAEVPGIYAGRYNARVRAINPLEVKSVPTYAVETQLNGKTTPPPKVSSLITTSLIWGIGLSWGFPAQGASDTERTELWYSTTSKLEDAAPVGGFAYPQNSHQMMGLAAGKEFFFWARLVDRSGNVGAFYPDGAGVRGVSSSDATPILEAIAGQINKEMLTGELVAQIDKIDKVDLIDDLAAKLDAYPDGAAVSKNIVRQDALYANQDALAASLLFSAAKSDVAESATRTILVARINDTKAEILTESLVRATEMAALAQTTVQLQASIDGTNAVVQQVQQAVADTNSALASTKTTLQASIDSNAAAVQTVQQAVTDTNSALATAKTQLEASIGNTNAAVQQTAQAVTTLDGKLAANYSVKVGITADGKYYTAGYGVGLEQTPEGMQAAFYVLADRFAIINQVTGSTTVSTPFVVQGGQIFMNAAFIGNAWITSAKIADAAVTTAKIADAQITTAKIADAQITTAKITDLAVSTLKIQGNAVTIPTSASGDGPLSASFVSTGQPVLVLGGISIRFNVVSTGYATAAIYLQRNGSTIAQFNCRTEYLAGGLSKYFLVSAVDSPGAGSVTYTVTASIIDGNASVVGLSNLFLLETKR